MATKGIRIPIMWKSDPRGLTDAEKRMKKFGDAAKIAGGVAAAGLALAGAAIIKVGAEAFESLKRIEVIGAQTEAAIRSTGSAANVTADQVRDLADRLEAMTATESEAVQEGANLLLTFTNIRNGAGKNEKVFDRATELMVDMARAMGTDAAGSAIQLGKALNDPIAGVTALTRMGVQFTDEQRDLIKSLVESNDMFGAQQVILDELETQFGGSGEAYAATIAGQIDTLNHNMGALAEEVVVELMPAIQSFLDWMKGDGLTVLRGFADWFIDEGVPAIQTFIDTIAKMSEEGTLVPAVIAGLGGITTAQLLLNGAMLANPAGAVIGTLMLLATQVSAVIANLDSFRITGENSMFVVALAVGGLAGVITSLIVNWELLWGVITAASTHAINGVLHAINFLLRGLQPVVDAFNFLFGTSFKLEVGLLRVPRIPGVYTGTTQQAANSSQRPGAVAMATGGVVMPRAGGTIAQIGEAGQAEAVMPLSWLEGQLGGTGDTVINVTVNAGVGTDGRSVGRQIVDEIRKYERASGQVWVRA